MNENYIMLNGKRVDLTDEQIEKLGLKIDCFHRSEEPYYFINHYGEVDEGGDNSPIGLTGASRKHHKVANYCTDKDLLQQRAYHETLSRLLWRFSMQNDGDKIDWDDCYQNKYHICYDYAYEKFRILAYQTMNLGEVTWFLSERTVQRAIDEIVLPFMEEHPDFVW